GHSILCHRTVIPWTNRSLYRFDLAQLPPPQWQVSKTILGISKGGISIADHRANVRQPAVDGGENEGGDTVRRQRHASAAVYDRAAETAYADRRPADPGTPSEMAPAQRHTRCLHHHRIPRPSDPQLLRRRPAVGPQNRVHRGARTIGDN